MNKQEGFSLVELMIAVLLSLILLAGVLSLFISTRASNNTAMSVNQIDDEGRAAMQFLRSTADIAGYMGCATQSSSIQNTMHLWNGWDYGTPGTPDGEFRFATTPFYPDYGFEFSGTSPGAAYTLPESGSTDTYLAPDSHAADWTTSLPPSLQNLVVPGSDVVAFSTTRSGTPAVLTQNAYGPVSTLHVTSTTNFGSSDIAMISDCAHAYEFRITGLTGTTISLDSGVGPAPQNASGGSPDFNVPAGSFVVEPDLVVYFIGLGQGPPGHQQPGLFRGELVNNGGSYSIVSQEIVPNVENMQVLYGTGPGYTDQYLTAAQVFNAVNDQNSSSTLLTPWQMVTSIRIGVLIRGPKGGTTLGGGGLVQNVLGTLVTVPRDTRVRRVFTMTIDLQNNLGAGQQR